MSSVYKYRVYCNTDSKYEYVWNTTAPTTCPTNTGHSINTGTISIVDEVSTGIIKIKEENIPTGENFRAECFALAGATGPDVSSTRDFTWPYPITVLEIKLYVEDQNTGDQIALQVGPNTVIGAITSSVSAGATSITVSSTVLEYLMKGYNLSLTDGVNTDDCGRVVNINNTTSTVTFDVATTHAFSHTSPTYVRQTVRVIDDFTLGPKWLVSIGDSKIGGAYVPPNTIVRTIYTNKGNTSKVLYAQIEYLY
jgi:hypothetical protein